MDDLFHRITSTGVGPRKEARGLDFYATPRWATQALMQAESIAGQIWEPCCGDGAIAEELQLRGHQVLSSDIVDRGYGSVRDFLDDWVDAPACDWVITNPPYANAEAFVRQALKATAARKGKVAMLLRLAFLEGQRRFALFEKEPLARVHVFSRRVDFVRGKASPMPVAWFVWDHSHVGRPNLCWIATGGRANEQAA